MAARMALGVTAETEGSREVLLLGWFPHLFLYFQSRTQVHGVMLATFRVDFPSSVKSLRTHLHKRCPVVYPLEDSKSSQFDDDK